MWRCAPCMSLAGFGLSLCNIFKVKVLFFVLNLAPLDISTLVFPQTCWFWVCVIILRCSGVIWSPGRPAECARPTCCWLTAPSLLRPPRCSPLSISICTFIPAPIFRKSTHTHGMQATLWMRFSYFYFVLHTTSTAQFPSALYATAAADVCLQRVLDLSTSSKNEFMDTFTGLFFLCPHYSKGTVEVLQLERKSHDGPHQRVDIGPPPPSSFILEDHLHYSVKQASVLDSGLLLCWYRSVTLSLIDSSAALLRLMDWLADCS